MKILYTKVESCLDCPSYSLNIVRMQDGSPRHVEKCKIMQFECAWIYPENLEMSRKTAFRRCKLPDEGTI